MPTDGLRSIAERLAAPSTGRTEADVQADVRDFLLSAPLELENEDVVHIALEAPVGSGQRIDVSAGSAIIEVKKDLGSKSVFEKAQRQLCGYVEQRSEQDSRRYVGVLTDGRTWVLFHLTPERQLSEVSRLELSGPDEADRLAAWLETILATTGSVVPTPAEIVRRLGATSPAAQLDLADLHALYATCRGNPEVQLKRELWARLLLSALGTTFENSDELFVVHTYLVLTAELVAHQVMGLPIDVPEEDVGSLLEGQQFAMAGLHGVVEADFFDWPAIVSHGRSAIAGMARRLGSFDWSEVNHDVLKTLYESVIDTDTRRKLGEYYTPDWLAQKIIEERFTDPLNQRLLDPACGSGTFLFWAVRKALRAYDAAGLPNTKALAKVVQQVQGLDLHPVAVTLARVTYLLALTPARLEERDELTVPVFLGDSVRWEQDDTLTTTDGLRIRTSGALELFSDDLHFPESVVEKPHRFDRLVAEIAARAARRKRGTKPPNINGLLNRHKVAGEADRQAVTLAFTKLCRLHDDGRDHVWSYYIRNLARPLAFSRSDGRADLLVGNPPWLAFRSMPDNLRKRYEALAKERGLWAGGKVASHQDLSDLFVARSVEQYLKLDGTFAFVMPFGALSRRQFAGFRTGDWSVDSDHVTCAQFEVPHTFAAVKPPLFPMPACVVSGSKTRAAHALGRSTVAWAGQLPSADADWKTVRSVLKSAVADVSTATDVTGSPYRALFRQGATIVPRVLTIVDRGEAGALGMVAGRVPIRSSRSSNEKPPWKGLGSLHGVVEEQFVRPLHNGSTIVSFRERDPELAVIPWLEGELLHQDHERLDEFPGLAAWWREAEGLYEHHRSASSRMTLAQRLNFQRLLTRQLPAPEHRIVYSASGQYLAACRLEDQHAVIEHKLYWAPVSSADEGRYLCAILNSQELASAVRPLQTQGQHNPRDFDMHVFALPFPLFDGSDPGHRDLVELASRAESIAATVHLDDHVQFQKSRRAVRDALLEDGIGPLMDAAVVEVVATATGAGAVPAADLMGVIDAAMAGVQRFRDRSAPKRKSRHVRQLDESRAGQASQKHADASDDPS